MATECGGYLSRSLVERPGKLVRWPLANALDNVERDGENREAWAKATSSAGVADPMAELAWATGNWCGEGALAWAAGDGEGEGTSSCQRRVRAVRWPVRMTEESRLTVTVVDVKATVQPASQNCPMEINDWDSRAGTMWTWRAARGKSGRKSSAVWVEYMISPFGLWMAIGTEAMRLLCTGISTVQKWAVQPVSAMATVEKTGMGGPTGSVVANS